VRIWDIVEHQGTSQLIQPHWVLLPVMGETRCLISLPFKHNYISSWNYEIVIGLSM